MNWMALSAETRGVVRDKNGVPVEWTLLRTGDNPICQEGQDGAIRLSGEDMRQIMEYHRKKGELIPIDSEHYLYELANRKKLDEAVFVSTLSSQYVHITHQFLSGFMVDFATCTA